MTDPARGWGAFTPEDIWQLGYEEGVAKHVEHHKCARCFDAGVAQERERPCAFDPPWPHCQCHTTLRAPSAPSEVK